MTGKLIALIRKISAASLLLLASQLILFLTMRLNADRLGPIGYGRFGLAMSVSVCAAQFIQWGMDQFLTARFVRGSPNESRHLLGVLLRQKQIAAIIVLAAAALFALIGNPQSQGELIFLGAVDGIILGFTIPSVFDARSRMSTWQFYAFLRHAAYVAAVLVLAVFFKQYYSPFTVLSLHALAIVFEVILEQLWIQKNYGLPQWPIPPRETLPLWREAAPMALAMLAQQTLFYIGPPALEFFGRSGEMGALNVSNQFTIGAASFIVLPSAVILARLAAHPFSGGADLKAFRKIVWRMAAACAVAGIFYSVAFDIAAEFIAVQYFPKYPSAPGIIAIDAWRLAPIFAAAPFASALICRGRLRAYAAAHVTALLVGTIAAIIFVPTHGAKAAAGAVMLGRVAFLLLSVIFFTLDKNTERPA